MEQLEFKAGGDNKEYKVETICDSAVYGRELETGHLSGLYYLAIWKGYLKDKNTWESASAMQDLRKLVSAFHKDCPNKPTATSLLMDSAPPIAQCTVPPNINGKQKHGQLIGNMRKKVKH